MARSKSTTAPAAESEPSAPQTPTASQSERVTIKGRLCADPQLRKTKSGISVSTIRVAVNHDNGDATFHSVVVWKKVAEAVCAHLKKGRLVEVAGYPRERTYTANDGSERTVTEIHSKYVDFSAGKKSASAEPVAA